MTLAKKEKFSLLKIKKKKESKQEMLCLNSVHRVMLYSVFGEEKVHRFECVAK